MAPNRHWTIDYGTMKSELCNKQGRYTDVTGLGAFRPRNLGAQFSCHELLSIMEYDKDILMLVNESCIAQFELFKLRLI